MKKIIVAVVAIVMVIGGVVIAKTGEAKNEDLIRIHIRANSQSAVDEQILVKVREQVIGGLSNKLVKCNNKKEAYNVVKNNLLLLEEQANAVISKCGANYKARITLREEEFPTRQYLNYTLKQGIYDSLTIELGSGSGENWWCVAFPPICFSTENKDYHYKSRLQELIEKYLS